jgi:serine protease DegS
MSGFRNLLDFVSRWAIIGLAVAFVVTQARSFLEGPDEAAIVSVPGTEPAGANRLRGGDATTSFADAVARSSPAVVNIYTARVITERVRPPELDRFFGDQWPAVRQRVAASLGSGVIVDSAGHVVTNNHVIAGASEIRLQLADGQVAPATVVGVDPETDLAVLKVSLPNLPVMPLGRSDDLKVGDVVLAIGNPLGLSQTVTQGIVSATGRGQLGLTTFENFIQTDAAINVGNSGGALVNSRGELIGINTAVLAGALQSEGIGFAIPVNLVRGVLQQIIEFGRVRRGWLGVSPREVSPDRAAALGLPLRTGVELVNVDSGSAAARAGLRPGDVITHMNGEAVNGMREGLNRVASTPPGTLMKIRVWRHGKTFEVTTTVEERPSPSG